MVGERTIDGQVFAAAALFGRACGLVRVLAVSVSRWPRPGWSEALGGRAQRRERDSRSESQRDRGGSRRRLVFREKPPSFAHCLLTAGYKHVINMTSVLGPYFGCF